MVHPLQIKFDPDDNDDDHPLSTKNDSDLPSIPRPKDEKPVREIIDTKQPETTWDKMSTLYDRSKSFIQILAYFRLALAMTLYVLIFVDVIHTSQKKDKSFWVEVLTQIINAQFTLLTIISHPKRLRNLPRAFQIIKAGGSGNALEAQGVPDEVKKIQLAVSEDYNWYTFEGEQMFLCSPVRLLFIILLWNIGSVAQYGIASILWFTRPDYRPLIPYIILSILASVCEFLPIPFVVMQTKSAKTSRELAAMDPRSRGLVHGSSNMRQKTGSIL